MNSAILQTCLHPPFFVIRVQHISFLSTYHPWVLNVHYLSASCPANVVPNNTRICGEMHVPRTDRYSALLLTPRVTETFSHAHTPHICFSYASFLDLAGKVFEKARGKGLLYIRIGGLVGWGHKGTQDPVAGFDRHVLENASWSWRLFDADKKRGKIGEGILNDVLSSKDGVRRTATKEKREFLFHSEGRICDGTDQLDSNGRVAPIMSSSAAVSSSILYAYVDKGGNIDPASPLRLPCLSVLASIKEERKAHWDVMAVTIDVLPSLDRPLASSVGALISLPLEFIRPKLVLVRVGRRADVVSAVRFLQRFGYIANSFKNVVFAHCVNVLELSSS